MIDRSRLSEGDMRALAVETVKSVLPSRAGDPWFEHVLCQDRTENRGYNPAPEICNWLLWRLGCRDSKVLSRNVPELNIQYTPRGIERMVLGAQRLAAWRPFSWERFPKPGDMLHMGSIARGEPEHLCVFISRTETAWTTADVVPCDKKGHWMADFVVRQISGYKMVGRSGIIKQINGWVDLGAVDFSAPPMFPQE